MRPTPDAIHTHTASIEIAASPETLYGMVSDVTRMGEWSPEAVGADWHDGATGAEGDWFVGHNRRPERDWSRECQVAKAVPGEDFTFVVGGVEANCTWWSYEFEPTEAGTTVTERWWIVNKTPALAAAPAEMVAQRVEMTLGMMQETLASLKAAAEA